MGDSRRPTSTAGKPSISLPIGEVGTLLDHGSGAHDALGTDHAAVTDDGARLNDGSGADVTAVDHGSGADDRPVVDNEFVVWEQV